MILKMGKLRENLNVAVIGVPEQEDNKGMSIRMKMTKEIKINSKSEQPAQTHRNKKAAGNIKENKTENEQE